MDMEVRVDPIRQGRVTTWGITCTCQDGELVMPGLLTKAQAEELAFVHARSHEEKVTVLVAK